MSYKGLYITLLLSLLLAACSTENGMEPVLDDRPIEISFRVDDFIRVGGALRADHPGSAAEQAVENLYLFLFKDDGTNPVKFYIDAATFTGGTWVNNPTEKKITLNMTQTQAGARQVYIVANCADLVSHLSAVEEVDGLKEVYRGTAQPWSTGIASPILMTGNATHNFITQDLRLESVHLTRAIAKIELNVTLSSGFQVAPEIEGDNLKDYKYRYVDFDTRTYVEKPLPTKLPNLESSSPDVAVWRDTERIPWGASLDVPTPPDTGVGYTLESGKVTGLKLITYLNERDEAGAVIEIELPRVDVGPLPPPEFGPELYKLPLPKKIERNTWYRYDIEI